jgi:pimeloyl-ACP methyl ester carboxylesterase
VTGEPDLDQVVPVAHTLGYSRLLPGAETVQLPRTGHLGVVTRPDVFASVVSEFVERMERRTVDRGERQAAG